jgi:hypothetical protein
MPGNDIISISFITATTTTDSIDENGCDNSGGGGV